MLNTILLALTALVTAVTPVLLAIINARQKAEVTDKLARLEQMHSEVISKLAPHA
jgi:hypothetical protein